MAKKETVELIDDLDGSPASETVVLGWRNKFRQVDLSADNVKRVEELLLPLIAAGRPVGRGPATKPAKASRASSIPGVANDAVRGWARENNFAVSDRGRIPSTVLSAYAAAHPSQ